ncbi:MAG TPA: DUF3392 family protein [Thiopseudomonas sp.]|nr:DUF3392 family protein [Thiopseudomonas sp.]
MDVITDWVIELSKWTRFNLSDISLAIMACALVLFGPYINARVRHVIGHLNFALRILVCAAVCAAAYGLSIIYLTPILANALDQLNNYTLAPVLLMIFALIGILADRN